MTEFEKWFDDNIGETIDCECGYFFDAEDAETDMSETLVLCPDCGSTVINLS